MESTDVYYIEFFVKNGLKLIHYFQDQYGFHLIAERDSKFVKQWVLRSGNAFCVITEPGYVNADESNSAAIDLQNFEDPYIVLNGVNSKDDTNSTIVFKPSMYMSSGEENDVTLDSVCNVALKVKDVGACVRRMMNAGAVILREKTSVRDQDGYVDIAVVKSCVGNVVHTLINSDNYNGVFLPSFKTLPSDKLVSNSSDITHFDHVTFACTVGSSSQVLDWYERCFGMHRFLMNRDEDEDEGFVIDTADIGLRLKAMEYWHCAEVGLTTPSLSPEKTSLKFVIAEALPDQGPNQVDTFLQEHGGPGIQHVGLHTPDIVKTLAYLQDNGVQFVEPPFTYYTEIGKLRDIQDIGQEVAVLKKYGVLVDAEPELVLADDGKQSPTTKFLMQKFTKPLFDKKTFFLELIHRAGAQGFGSGNITALWRSVQAYMSAKEQTDTPKSS